MPIEVNSLLKVKVDSDEDVSGVPGGGTVVDDRVPLEEVMRITISGLLRKEENLRDVVTSSIEVPFSISFG